MVCGLSVCTVHVRYKYIVYAHSPIVSIISSESTKELPTRQVSQWSVYIANDHKLTTVMQVVHILQTTHDTEHVEVSIQKVTMRTQRSVQH